MLFATACGNGPPVVAVHGFTQTGASWAPIVERLRDRHRFVLVDAPGHGRSGDVRVELGEGARLLGAAGGNGAYLGYSMGARLCLHLALARPDLVTNLVLIGVHPGIADPAERAGRLADDSQLARRIEQEGVEAFIDWWLTRPLFSTLPASAARREERLANTAAGLASSLRLAGTGCQEPLWGRLPELAMPVLVVAGAADAKFAALGRLAAAAIGRNAELVLIPDAGHACHLERPDQFCPVLTEFLH